MTEKPWLLDLPLALVRNSPLAAHSLAFSVVTFVVTLTTLSEMRSTVSPCVVLSVVLRPIEKPL
jgi:hypothetical protein